MPGNRRYPAELRERAVRMVLDNERLYGSQWEAIWSVAEKLGPTPETVRLWVAPSWRSTAGPGPGVTTAERARIKELERENRELRRANEILQGGVGFFRVRGSTASRRDSGVHRRPQGPVRGRADLRCAVRAQCRDRPVRLLRSQGAGRRRLGLQRDAFLVCAQRSLVCTQRTITTRTGRPRCGTTSTASSTSRWLAALWSG